MCGVRRGAARGCDFSFLHTNQRCRAPQANFEVGYTHVERRSLEARAKQVLEADARHTECSTRLLLCLSAAVRFAGLKSKRSMFIYYGTAAWPWGLAGDAELRPGVERGRAAAVRRHLRQSFVKARRIWQEAATLLDLLLHRGHVHLPRPDHRHLAVIRILVFERWSGGSPAPLAYRLWWPACRLATRLGAPWRAVGDPLCAGCWRLC